MVVSAFGGRSMSRLVARMAEMVATVAMSLLRLRLTLWIWAGWGEGRNLLLKVGVREPDGAGEGGTERT